MGITGLLPFLSPLHRKVHISQYKGLCVAVDTYCWLHRGAFSCAFELATGVPTQRYVNYVVKRIKLLQHHNILPIMVFDGCNAPSKKLTDDKRRDTKKINKEKGRQLLAEGKKAAATDMFQKSLNITGDMALEVIKVCYDLNIPVIVAPYEADAQLTYLVNKNIVDVIITEDSDLMVFGCQRVLFKLDDNGDGVEIRLADIGTSTEEPRMDGWSLDKFRQMCVMSGCDYLDRLPMCGLKTVHKQFRKFANVERGIKSLVAEKNMKKVANIDPNYYQKFLQANLAFKHHLVFDPVTQSMVPLNPLPPHSTLHDMPFLGRVLGEEEVTEIACGNTNPNNGKKVASFAHSYSSLVTRCNEWRESKGTSDRSSEGTSKVHSVSEGAITFSNKAEAVTPVVHQEPKKFFSTKRSNDYVLETVQLNGDEALAKIYGTGKRRKVIPQTNPQLSRFFATPQSAQPSSNPFAIKKPPPQAFSPEKENSSDLSPEKIKIPIPRGADKSASTFKSIMKPCNVKYSSAIKYDQFINLDKDEEKEDVSDKEVLRKIPTPENHHFVKVGLSRVNNVVGFKPPIKTVLDSSQSKKMAVTSKPSPWINTAAISKKKVVNLSKPSPKTQPTLKNFMKSSQSSNDNKDSKTKSKYF